MNKSITIKQLNPFVRYAKNRYKYNKNNHFVPWRIIYDYEIIFVYEGSLRVVTENEEFDVQEFHTHIMPPFVKHTQIIANDYDCSYFCVHLDFNSDDQQDFNPKDVYEGHEKTLQKISPEIKELLNRNIYVLSDVDFPKSIQCKNPKEMMDLYEELINSMESNRIYDKILQKSIIIRIIAEIVNDITSDKIAEKNELDNLIETFLDYVINHYSESIDIESIIEKQGISKSHFRRIFKQKMKKSPHKFLLEYRVEKAKKLLATNKYTTAEVSYMVGYDDPNYFSRLFKTKENILPSDYKKRRK